MNATKAAGVDNAAQVELLKTLTQRSTSSRRRLADAGQGARPPRRRRPLRPREVLARQRSCRRWSSSATLGDKLETMVADDLWPLPTYREMLFIR